ncbi:MAG: Na(+)-translocating NADH-quinone reductase subunit A [Maritimibacter sp.]|nr:Na(+)-translocating NADH-quinone reductase subunit A [Maritimibacter sp.]
MTVLGAFNSGLNVRIASPRPAPGDPATVVTEEAALTAQLKEDFRVEPLVAEGALVAQGAPVLASRRNPAFQVTAPMPARVAAIRLGPGHRLSSVLFFHEPDAGRHAWDTKAADDPAALRTLLLSTGLWRNFRSRPFGHVPLPGETPAAIFVMGADTRPHAPDPGVAIAGQEAALARGLAALTGLTTGTVFLCHPRGAPRVAASALTERVKSVTLASSHPQGLAGTQIHRHRPARIGAPVWDIALEDVAAIGALLETGHVAETRLVSIAGPALRDARLVRSQPGADLKQLCHGHVRPGPHEIWTGSALDGHESHWLGGRDRQVTVFESAHRPDKPHWFQAALARASRPKPLIPTAALDLALGGALPAMPFLRALASGDTETFTHLGGLSLLEEDLALADYVTRAEPSVRALLAAMLDTVATEEAAGEAI